MTHARPMFPPFAGIDADLNKCSDREHFRQASPAAHQVKNSLEIPPIGGVSGNSADLRDIPSIDGISRADANLHLEGPPIGGGSAELTQPLYLRTDISPDELFQALGRLRNEAAAEVERLLALIDQIDGDSDLEPSGDDEPDLGSVAGGRKPADQTAWAIGVDAEPSLAAPENHAEPDEAGTHWYCSDSIRRDCDGAQQEWATSSRCDDREHADADFEADEHDGREPDVDDELSGDENEPWLGSFDRLANQDAGWRQTGGTLRTWITHTNCDAEADSAA